MLFFAGLWTQCDKEGRFLWRPRSLKLDILPYLKYDVEKSLEVLELAGYLRRYTVDGEKYGEVVNFSKHQLIFGSESKYEAKYPNPLAYDGLEVQGSPRLHQDQTLDHGVKELRIDGVKELRNNGWSGLPTKHPFEKSPVFDFEKFKEAIPNWSDEKLRHYHQAAIEYSGSKGVKYFDWKLAVLAWDRKTPYAKETKRKGEHAENISL